MISYTYWLFDLSIITRDIPQLELQGKDGDVDDEEGRLN